MRFPWLSVVVFLPLVGAALTAALPERNNNDAVRWSALAVSLATFLASVGAALAFDPSVTDFQLVERARWIPALGAEYHLGVDGVSLPLVLLTTFLMPLAIAASWKVQRRVKMFHVALLSLGTGMLGVFLAIDMLLFYLFWEASLIPMYFIIGAWGYERRVYAAVKFFLYTLAGSLLMLVAILVLASLGAQQLGSPTFSLTRLSGLELSTGTGRWLFLAFFAAFAVKMPLFPFHTWLPDAHTEAPTAGSVLLAGVLLKMGAYGLIRFSMPLFPEAFREFTPWLVFLAVVGIIWGGIASAMQRDLKRLIAYSSVSHLGFVALGIASGTGIGMAGAVFIMVSHGLTTGALFFLVGMLYERAHTRQIADFGGLAKTMPLLGGLFLFSALASLGLPGLSGFAGEFLVLVGTFPVRRAPAIASAFGVVLAAVYLLWAYERVFHGPQRYSGPESAFGSPEGGRADLVPRELAILAPIVTAVLVLGLFPQTLIRWITPSTGALIERSVGVAPPQTVSGLASEKGVPR